MFNPGLASSFRLVAYVYEEFDFSYWTLNPVGTDLFLPCCDGNPSEKRFSMLGRTITGIIYLTLARMDPTESRNKAITVKPCKYDQLDEVIITGEFIGTRHYRNMDKYYIDSLIRVPCWPELNEPPPSLKTGDWVTLTGTLFLDLDE